MANNRMWLCNKVTGQEVLLAKYYPSQGWHCFHGDLNVKLDGLFSDQGHLAGDENDYEFVYEENKPPACFESPRAD